MAKNSVLRSLGLKVLGRLWRRYGGQMSMVYNRDTGTVSIHLVSSDPQAELATLAADLDAVVLDAAETDGWLRWTVQGPDGSRLVLEAPKLDVREPTDIVIHIVPAGYIRGDGENI